MAAFALLHTQEMRVTINLILFAMQAGAGFIDLAYMLRIYEKMGVKG